MKVLSLVSAFLLAASISTAAFAAKTSAWQFVMFDGQAFGRFKVTIAHNAAFFDNGVFNYLIATPDFDRFVVLNPENHTYLRMNVEEFLESWQGKPIAYPKLQRTGTGKMMGLNCEHYAFDKPGQHIDAWFTHGVDADSRLITAICKCGGVPQGYGLPVRVNYKTGNSNTLLFDLLKSNKISADASLFAIPASYKLVKDKAVFYLSDDGKTASSDELFSSVRSKSSGQK